MAGEWAEDGRKFWLIHGILMILAWGILIPTGTLLAVYRRYVGKAAGENVKILKNQPSFYPWHRNLQWTGFMLSMIAFGIAAKGSINVYDTGNPFDDVLLNFTSDDIPWNHHVKYGIAVIIMSCGQVIAGVLAHILKDRHTANSPEKEWKRPIIPSWLHVIMGIGCMITAFLTMYQGLQIYDFIFYKLEKSAGIKFGYAVVTISLTTFISGYIYEKISLVFCGGNSGNKPSNDDKEEQPAV